ncbi:hypothetical protein BDV93DRAFT_400336, partial [Ceratobasidium sp. AG-I]
VYKRCPLEIVRHLIGLQRLRDHMQFGPEREWTTTIDGRRIRVYSEMWTGNWWWRLQNLLGEGATIAPFIIASDETQLTTLSGSKVAWPVYASIGNISKHVRRRPSERTMLLLGYIPVAKLAWISDEKERRTKRWELYHASMAMILEPLKAAARDGVEMTCADGSVRRVHPVLSTHIGDWPEQCSVGCCNNTRCPICVTSFGERGQFGPAARLRTKPETLRALRFSERGYTALRVGLGLRPVWPYWGDHPWSSGPSCTTPDLLHQLWKGVFTHTKTWWSKLLGKPELDKRYTGVPRYASHRHFSSGLSPLTQWTGNEAKAVAKVFLPVIAGDTPLLAVRAARCVVDFMYRARQPQLDEDDLASLELDLAELHDCKAIFQARRVHISKYGFNKIAKLHMLRHYPLLIREWGTPDGYNTEGPERLHIDCVKVNYRRTNGVNPEAQMLLNLQRTEALALRRAELERAGLIPMRQRRYQPDGVSGYPGDDSDNESSDNTTDGYGSDDEGEGVGEPTRIKEQVAYQPEPLIRIAKRPPIHNLAATTIIATYNAPGFIEGVRDYLEPLSANLAFHINEQTKFGLYSRFSLIHQPLPFAPLAGSRVELVRASPATRDHHGLARRAAFFDTVLIEDDPDFQGILHYCAARLLVIFQLPRWCHDTCSQPLAYVELFDKFTTAGSQYHRLLNTKPLKRNGERVRLVIPLTKIRMTCHLVP